MGCKSNCFCCIICVLLTISLFVICGTLMILEYVGVKPRFYIEELYIPALNNSHTYNALKLNSSLIIDLKFKRVVTRVPLRYQDFNITLYYGLNRSFSVGHYYAKEIPPGNKKTVRRRAVVAARGLPWEDAFQKISGGSTVAVTVVLGTKYQLKRCDDDGSCSYGKAKSVVNAADVAVDGSGVGVSKKPIRLR